MQTPDKIKTILQNKFENFESTPSLDRWENIAAKLPPSPPKKSSKSPLLVLLSIAAALAMIIVLTVLILPSPQQPTQPIAQQPQPSVLPKTPPPAAMPEIARRKISPASQPAIPIATVYNKEENRTIPSIIAQPQEEIYSIPVMSAPSHQDIVVHPLEKTTLLPIEARIPIPNPTFLQQPPTTPMAQARSTKNGAFNKIDLTKPNVGEWLAFSAQQIKKTLDIPIDITHQPTEDGGKWVYQLSTPSMVIIHKNHHPSH